MATRRRLRAWAPARPFDLAQAAAALLALVRLAGARRRPPPRPGELPPGATASVVIPARDDAATIGPCLEALCRDPQVLEVIVVDDRSVDGTAALARAAGATVLAAGTPPPGWDRRRWALAEGVRRAGGGWVLALDPAARPEPGLVGAAVTAAAGGGDDLLALTPSYACADPVTGLLHPSMLAARAYLVGPPGGGRRARPATAPLAQPFAQPLAPAGMLDDGRCLLIRRGAVAGGGARDRGVAAWGERIGVLDGTRLLTVGVGAGPGRSARRLARSMDRSLARALPTSPAGRAADLAVLWLTMALPPLRLAVGRGTVLDVALVAARVGVAAALRRRYARPGAGVWLSPLADLPVAVRLTVAALAPGGPAGRRGRRRGAATPGAEPPARPRAHQAATPSFIL